MTRSTSDVAVYCSNASSRSRASRASSSSATGGGLERISTFGALRRVGFGVVDRRPLVRSPPALERLFIASPWAEEHLSRSSGGAGSSLLEAFNEPLRRQLLQQRLRLLQIARVEPLCEPPVKRSALAAPFPGNARGGRGSWRRAAANAPPIAHNAPQSPLNACECH
jgi:hypothetical protein